jgi:hypothetical protein
MPKMPDGLQPLLDGDIVRYELGFAAESGWRGMHPDVPKDELSPPPWDYVERLLLDRIETIKINLRTDKDPIIYYTSGPTFRFDIAKKKPYKGTRKENKPWHYDNLTVYLRDVLHSQEVTGIEADDRLAIEHCNSGGATVLCSRDKDLKQIPGWFYSWELGLQPSWGPDWITKEGSLKFTPADPSRKRPAKLTGTGLSWFYAQVLIGDPTDNVPGCPGWGPVAAYEALNGKTPEEQYGAVLSAYYGAYPGMEEALVELREQGKLIWLVRQLDQNGMPVTWEPGMTE